MSKHTPGPWEWHTPATTAARHPAYVTAGNSYIAAIYHGDKQMESLPNTRLIAAAPDLLDALKEIVSQIDQGGAGGKVFSRDACIAQARAAIAKATGGEV